MKLNNEHYIVNTPKVSWVLVANRAGAAIFRKEPGVSLEFVERFENPNGRLRESELVTDKPGITGGGSNHSLGRGPRRHEQTAIDFSIDLIKLLDTAHKQERFSELVLVAEPHFLGLLRKSLTSNLKTVPLQVVGKEVKVIETSRVEKALNVIWKRPKASRRAAA